MDIFDNIALFFSDEVGPMSIILLMFAGISIVFASGLQLYTKIRPRFPVRVNCWFCNKDTDVNFVNRNSWDCPYCEQYNGFLQDGDYNKIIPAQGDELLNHPVTANKRKPFKTNDNGLCRKCNVNQEMKVQQLASFIPIDNARFDEEVELYRQRLERAYQLCPGCDEKMNQTLIRIRSWLKKMYAKQAAAKSTRSVNHSASRGCRLLLVVSGVSRILSLLLSTAVCILLGAPLLLPFLPAEKQAGARTLLDAGLVVPFQVITGALLLLGWMSASCWLAPELLPVVLWMLSGCVSYEKITLGFNINQQLQVILQVAVTVIAVLSTIWVNTKLSRRSALQHAAGNTGLAKPRVTKKKAAKSTLPDMSDFSDDENSSIEKSENPLEMSAVPDKEGLTVKCPPVDSESYHIDQEPPQSPLDPVELQSGLGGLSLGPQAPYKTATPSLFEPRIYQTPNLFNLPDLCSSPLSMDEGMGNNWGPHRRKPVLSPARLHLNKLTHSSWVAGGYWQNHHFPTPFPPSSFYYNQNSFSPSFPLSRSSSQSSGFASQGGTNYSSLPNSRTGSVCDADRFSVLSEPIYPSYAPPLASYCCYVSAPPSGPTFYFPPPPSPPSPPVAVAKDYSSSENEGKTIHPTKTRRPTSAPQKTFLAVIKENFLLATLFFSSLVFNAVVIALAAMNTFQVLN